MHNFARGLNNPVLNATRNPIDYYKEKEITFCLASRTQPDFEKEDQPFCTVV